MNDKKPEERFIKLVEETGGFEYYQAFRDDVDHVLGGKGDVFLRFLYTGDQVETP